VGAAPTGLDSFARDISGVLQDDELALPAVHPVEVGKDSRYVPDLISGGRLGISGHSDGELSDPYVVAKTAYQGKTKMKAYNSVARLAFICAVAFISEAIGSAGSTAAEPYRIFVSNERSGDVTIIDGTNWAVIATVAVGKRPRGIHPSPDGKRVYVTLSGTPLAAPPQLDAHGNPILKKGADDDDTDEGSDKSADGIGVLDVTGLKLEAQLASGSDPEEFAVSRDGKYLYVSNEDTKSVSVVKIATGKVEHIIPVTQDAEGVGITPDGTQFYVTCETAGDVFAVNASSYAIVGRFKVEPRPRSIAFLPGVASLAFVPSESVGQINVVDTKRFQVLKVIQLPKGARPMKVLLAPDARHLYISNGRAGSISVLDTRTYQLVAEITAGKRPWGLAISPDGKYLFTANGPSNDVSVIDLETTVKSSASAQALVRGASRLPNRDSGRGCRRGARIPHAPAAAAE